MKVCLISLSGLPLQLENPRTTAGGSERQVTLLAQALAGRGHEVILVVTDYDRAARREPRATPFPLENAYRVRAGIPGLRFLHPRWAGLDRALGRADAEVIFQRGAGAVTGQAAWFARRRGLPFVFGLASDTDADPDRVRLGFRDRRLYRYGLRRARRVVAQHRHQAEALRAGYGVESTVIGSIAPHLPERVEEPASPPVVAWLGNFRALKRPELFLAMAHRFPDVRFQMMGGPVRSEPGCLDTVRSEAASLPNVEFLGPTPDPGPRLARAWVLLNTSELEGYPSSFVEAWGHGVPTVSFVDPGGVIAARGLGLVASEPGDLGRVLESVLGARTLRDELGTRARAYARSEHAPDAVAARYETLFAEAADAARRRS